MFTGSLPIASNRADWSEIFEVFDDETGEQIDLSDSTILLEVRDDCRRVTASTALVDIGKFEATIPRDQMRRFCSGTFEVGCTLMRDGIVTQEFIGSLSIMNGVVR
jgi:hypothetical protein